MKRLLGLALAAMLAWGTMIGAASAEEKGLYRYEVKEDGTAEITGITDNNIEMMEIPAEIDGYKVTSIESFSFSSCDKLEKAVIPEGVTSVGSSLFVRCEKLESVSIPDSLVYMYGGPFVTCPKLKTIEVSPDHPAFAVENGTLTDRKDMTLIRILDREGTGTYTAAQGIRKIEDFAFEGSAFSSVILPDSLDYIGNCAFMDCKNLTEMVIPEGVTAIGNQVFFDCDKLRSVTLPDSLARVGGGIFANADSLASVRISPDHTAYEMIDCLLVKKENGSIVSALNCVPAKYEIPEGIGMIGGYSFQGCGELMELIIPEGVTTIGYDAFSGCSKLWKVTLPASMEEIRDNAFWHPEKMLIQAPAGSWAQKYSEENGYRFEELK